jgi:metal-responsive CopG/Arc/MetJ family transcriptional regulator
MESVTIKMEESLTKEMNKVMIPLYSTKTEFIREAIRDKIELIRKREALEALKNLIGSSNTKTSDKEFKKHREEVAKKYMKKFNINLEDLKS